MMTLLKNKYGTAVVCSVAFSMAVLSGCSSSSSPNAPSSTDITGSAIDGYVVGGDLYCDGVPNGLTGAKGSYSCPEGTVLAKVMGGIDVGYDEAAISDGADFHGVLTGPADGEFITPVTSLVVLLASDSSGNYDPSLKAAAVETLKKALGVETLDLSTDPADNLAMAKLNAQLSSIVSSFSTNPEDYAVTLDSLANLLKSSAENNEVFDVSAADEDLFSEKLGELNDVLGEQGTGLGRSAEELEEIVTVVKTAVTTIEETEEHEDFIKEVANIPLAQYDLGIIKAAQSVRVEEAGGQYYNYSMKNYITPDKNNGGRHQIVLTNGVNKVEFDNTGITVQKTLTDQEVDLGIKIEADDGRSMNLIGRGAMVSMTAGDSSSVDVKVPDGMVWEASAVSATGTRAYTQLEKDGDKVFSSSNTGIVIGFDAISKRLGKVSAEYTAAQFLDLTNETGDFKITIVIDGLKVAKIVNNGGDDIVYSAWGYNVAVKKGSAQTVVDSLYAPGWEGYFTVE